MIDTALPNLHRAMRSSYQMIIALALALMVLGTIMIYSGSQQVAAELSDQTITRLAYCAMAFALFLMICCFDCVHFFRRAHRYLLAGSIVLLALTLVPGLSHTYGGASRWLDLGVITIQPVELVKMAMLIYYAQFCSQHQISKLNFRELAEAIMPLCLVGAILLVQPDFGSLVLLSLIVGMLFFLSGLRWRYIASLAIIAAGSFVYLVASSPYRLARLMIVADPFSDPYGRGYQQVHSLIAFNQGGWFGTGLGNSIEKWGHLPKLENDFIISLIAEELGFIGFVLVIAVFLCLFFCIFRVAKDAQYRDDLFASFYCYGAVACLFFQMLTHIAGNLALAPVKGFNLPLVSAGGTHLLATTLMLAILVRIGIDNYRGRRSAHL